MRQKLGVPCIQLFHAFNAAGREFAGLFALREQWSPFDETAQEPLAKLFFDARGKLLGSEFAQPECQGTQADRTEAPATGW